MAHPAQAQGSEHRPAISSRARLTLSILLVGAALLTCGNMCGRISAVTLTHAPASALSLDFGIEPSSSPQVLQPAQVVLSVIIFDGSGALVELRNGQKLACNGVAFPEGHVIPIVGNSFTSNWQVTLPLQPPGGAYTCVYTDEAGRQTSLVIPSESPQIHTPREGDVVPIPRPKAGVTIPPSGTPGPSAGPSPTVGDRTPDQTSSLVVGFALPSLPAGWTAPNYSAVVSVVGWRAATCPDLPQCVFGAPCGSPDECGGIGASLPSTAGSVAATTTSLTVSDGIMPIGRGFESFQPGPGWVELHASFDWTQAKSPFAGVHVRAGTRTGVHITWTRP